MLSIENIRAMMLNFSFKVFIIILPVRTVFHVARFP